MKVLGMLQVSPQVFDTRGVKEQEGAPTHGPCKERFVPALWYLPSASESNHSTTGGACQIKTEIDFKVKMYYVQDLGLRLLMSSISFSISQSMVWRPPCLRIRGPVSIANFGSLNHPPMCGSESQELTLQQPPRQSWYTPKSVSHWMEKNLSYIFKPSQQILAAETKIGFFLLTSGELVNCISVVRKVWNTKSKDYLKSLFLLIEMCVLSFCSYGSSRAQEWYF